MRREVRRWYSPSLQKDMDMMVYGHFGFALLMIPSAASDCYEYEQRGIIQSMKHLIEEGKFKVYVVSSVNGEAWMNQHAHGYDKARRHEQFNNYITDEIVPFIYQDCNGPVPIYPSGVSMGALFSAILFFRRPDLFAGMLSLSGSYDLKDYTQGYFDENVYYNSPMDFLAKQESEVTLAAYKADKKIIIATGQGAWERPDRSREFAALLKSRAIPHYLDVWGQDIPHDWESWLKMYPYFMGRFF